MVPSSSALFLVCHHTQNAQFLLARPLARSLVHTSRDLVYFDKSTKLRHLFWLALSYSHTQFIFICATSIWPLTVENKAQNKAKHTHTHTRTGSSASEREGERKNVKNASWKIVRFAGKTDQLRNESKCECEMAEEKKSFEFCRLFWVCYTRCVCFRWWHLN